MGKYLFILSSLLLISCLQGEEYCYSKSFSVQGEWLYMMPAIDNPHWAIQKSISSARQNGEVIANEPGWYSGSRVTGAYRFGSCHQNAISVGWTRFHFNEDQTLSGTLSLTLVPDDLDNAENFTGTADICDRYRYDAIEALIRFLPWRFCCLDCGLGAGLQYADLSLKEEVIWITNLSQVGDLKYTLQMWGIGPELVLDFYRPIWRCLGMTGKLSGALLVSKTSAKAFTSFSTVTIPIVDVTFENIWRFVPTNNIRLGLDFEKRFSVARCSFNLTIEAGYELLAYYRPFYRGRFLGNGNRAAEMHEYMDFILHGPYVHVGLDF